uniref:Uncharacterized protein n=1 Tax=Anguilla anguilla TaxID=7936 RepID=A0A0E9UXH2_ANGAN
MMCQDLGQWNIEIYIIYI